MNQPCAPPSAAAADIPPLAVPLLSLAAFGSGISFRVTDSLLPYLAREFQVSLGDASYVVTLFAVAYGFAQLFFGPLGDRYGKYRVVAFACLACAVAAALSAAATGFSMLLVTRLLSGATAAALIPLSLAWIGDVIPYEKRHPVLARFLIGQIVGLSVGVLVGGVAADAENWRVPFAGIALVFLVVGAVLLLVNRRLPERARLTRKGEALNFTRSIGEFSNILRVPWARVVLLAVILEGGFLYGAFAFIPAHMHRVHAMSLTAAGALIMLFGLGGVLFATAAGRLSGRLSEARLALTGGAIAGLSLLAIGLAPLWWWALPGCFGAGLGFYMMHTTLQINATQMAPERRGAAVSVFASCFFLGQSTGVGLAGLSVEFLGTSAVIALGGLGILVVAAYFASSLTRRPAA